MLPSSPSGPVRMHPRHRLLVAAAVGAYAASFPWAFAVLGPAVGAFGAFPVLLAAWYGGRRGGLWASALLGGLNFVLYSVALPELDALAHVVRALPAVIVFGATGYGLGRLRDLSAAVRRAGETYRVLFESANDAILLLDPETEEIIRANERAAELYGVAREALVGRSLKAFSVDVMQGEGHVDELLEAGRTTFETRQRRGDGTEIDIRVSASLVEYEGRRAILSHNRDVTALKRTEAALRQSEQRARRLALVASRTINGVVITDTAGHVEWVNEGFTRIAGYTLDELIGRKPGSLLQGPGTDPETVALMRERVRRRERFSVEVLNYAKDGRPYWIRIEAEPLADEAGRPVGFMAIETDVTEQREAEQALRASEARFRNLIHHSSDVVTVLDAEGRITYESPSAKRVLGYAPEDLVGRNAFEFVHPDDVAAVAEGFAAVAASPGEGVPSAFRWRHADGAWVHLEAVGTNRLDDPAVRGIVVNSRDVTASLRYAEERAARERAEEMLRLKDAFLSNMSHELRTPLTGILGFAEVLAEEAPPDLQEPAAVIHRSARRLMDTLNSVLDLAQLEGGAVELRPEPLDVLAEAREAVALLAPVAGRAGLTLTVEGEVTPVALDRPALHRILNNLVGNALKFTEEGGVTVRVEPVPGAVRLRVSDTGIGINEAFLPRLYGEFQQASTGLAREHEGNGLGLTITKRLVDLLGGTIAVESTVGEGTTFTVTLPAALPPSVGDGAATPEAVIAEAAPAG